ncbi:hypothetical protein, variant [Phialophora macrospora]|uniref:Uncharacterized protein n=1 Tax=Phialophora macrospora TaxID=1851006 RepID=A0A0D2EES3_9EURO|nr:hypothetical protein PV04_00984 [Phialophora macrospora]KIW72813.1 hypothetical protein, variant [Phialophora macrospora]
MIRAFFLPPSRLVRYCLVAKVGPTGLSLVCFPLAACQPDVKLAWRVSMTGECLVNALEVVLVNAVDKDVRIGSTGDVQVLSGQETGTGGKKVGIAGCAPSGHCDNVGAALRAAGKAPTTFGI